jgi:ATP-dependent DNA helicase RecG
VVGTHALLTEGVGFKSLAVAVIDEQHRFGVHQRAGLTAKARGGFVPHVLVMTATPIPRTLAMTLFGDLDVSTIEGLPPGRKPVKTRVVDPAVAGEVYAWVRTRLELGEQAFIVAPAIDPVEGIGGPGGAGVGGGAGELGTVASVVALVERLRAGELHGKRLEVLHGQMPAPEREATMKRFRAGEIDALVATTIVEVGVDVPNATVMVVEQAERFGLAQLHQLRGRVGRGGKGGACILIGKPMTPDAEARLAALAASGDGFALAERDLEIRGFGDLLGVRQSGMPPFKVADLTRDLDLLTLARRDAAAVAAEDPLLAMSGRGLLKRRLLKAHGGWLELGGVG